MRYLITNADDYGYRPDISQAIIEAHKQGTLTSTTVLVNFVSGPDAKRARDCDSLGLGLHLNLTSGKPISENWQNKYGDFSRPHRGQADQWNQELWVDFFERYETDDVYSEYEAQMTKFIELFDKLPTHIDSHHYSGSYAKTLPAFERIAKEYSLPIRRLGRFDVAERQHPEGNLVEMPALTTTLLKRNIRTTEHFSTVFWSRFENRLEIMHRELQRVSNGECMEFAFHPGYDEIWRQQDLEFLKSTDFQNLINTKGFELINFSQLI